MEQPGEAKDYYAVLGITSDAPQEEIARAYRRLIKTVHPDSRRGKTDSLTGRRVAELVEAWRVLGDGTRRASYDRARRRPAFYTPTGAPHGRPPAVPPMLEVSTQSITLEFVRQGETAEALLHVVNPGGTASAVEWAGVRPGWLSVLMPPNAGASLRSEFDLVVSVDTNRLRPHHVHRAQLSFCLAGPSGLHSNQATIDVAVRVAGQEAPRLMVRPAGWVVESWECEGAPKSLLLSMIVENGGGGRLVGSVETPPWVTPAAHHFGPLSRDSSEERLTLQVDCVRWKQDGLREGSLWVSTEDGDGCEVVLVGSDGCSRSGSRLPRPDGPWWMAVVAGVALGPLASLLAGLPIPFWALFLPGALVIPYAAHQLKSWQLRAVGHHEHAPGWGLGPEWPSWQLAIVVLMWALLAWLAVTVGGKSAWILGVLSAPNWVAAPIGAICAASVAARHGLVRAASRRLAGFSPAGRAISAAVVPAAWAVLAGTIADRVAPSSFGAAKEAGAAAGWLLGVAILYTRCGVSPSSWLASLRRLLREVVPLVGAALGLAAGVGISVSSPWRHLPAGDAAMNGAALGSSLLGLPEASLASALAALIMAMWLVLGFGIGMLAVVPSSGAAIERWGYGEPGIGPLRSLRVLGVSLVESCVLPDDETATRAQRGRSLIPREALRWVPKSTLVVGLLVALLSVYLTAHLLLAVVAFMGIVAG